MKTVKDLASAIGVDPSTISRAISSGKIRVIVFGRAIRIPIDEYDRIVREGYAGARKLIRAAPVRSAA
ncbi:hypothetical protein [Rubrimonas sp.]|uniref:hypothetical protein n=1 Tax=Rubrimonas sp. TaxID=2036015 RepID=UPI002FDC7AD1